MPDRPKVSVCIPTFNGANYLRQAVDSVLEQNYQDFEVIIVDNCSTDHTAVVVNSFFLRGDPRIRFYKNEQNYGLAGNFNECLKYAKGIYIKFLCVDDLLLPGCLERMVAGLDTYQTVTVVCGGRLIINQAGEKYGLRRYSSREELIPGQKAITRCLFGGNYIGEPTAVMFRNSDLNNYFREDLPQLMDMEMWFQLLERGYLLNIDNPICAIRIHDAQMTQSNIKSGDLIADNIKLIDSYLHKPYLETTPILKLRLKLLMTYRVWISRKYISSEKKKMILERYALSVAYPLMPLVGFVVTLKKSLARRASSFLGNSKF